MADEEYSQEELRRLAAGVVEKILESETLSEILIQRLEAARTDKDDCPNDGTLCCAKNYKCPVRFSCVVPYRCSNGHTETLQGWTR